ncbi:MAG TPA: hypothetical protein VE935_22790 [Burkholderiales bacterium]|jgi:hypothetical protein|nr:hypothetical protein [Burkholderiales bacterium]
MRRSLALLLLFASLAGCAEQGPWFKSDPLDQDPGARAGSHGSVLVGRGHPKGD